MNPFLKLLNLTIPMIFLFSCASPKADSVQTAKSLSEEHQSEVSPEVADFLIEMADARLMDLADHERDLMRFQSVSAGKGFAHDDEVLAFAKAKVDKIQKHLEEARKVESRE